MCKAYEREKEKNIKEGIKIGEKQCYNSAFIRGYKRGYKRGLKFGEEKALNMLKTLFDSLKKSNIAFDAYQLIMDDNYRKDMQALLGN